MENRFTLTWEVDKLFHESIVREFLKVHDISRSALTDIKFKGGSIQVNGEEVSVRHRIRNGDIVTVAFPPEHPSEGLIAQYHPLTIVYEDDYLLVVNKSPYMPSIPSREHPIDSLSNALLYYYEQQRIQSTIHLVNRLDRDTSGLLIVAKYRHVHCLFSRDQQKHLIHRTYRAFVHGGLAEKQGTINAPIGRKDRSIIEREVRDDGQHAVTHYSVIQTKNDITEVALKLETGRTHQIRVHMAYLGTPLLGDTLYGGRQEKIKRQALHSYELTFFHPILKKQMMFRAPLPDDMTNLFTGH
ncbi:RluA family pseudouridine synthase [Priestia megaterium]|nr:RluA family pseudouridine synthase [Priestia megaterium]